MTRTEAKFIPTATVVPAATVDKLPTYRPLAVAAIVARKPSNATGVAEVGVVANPGIWYSKWMSIMSDSDRPEREKRTSVVVEPTPFHMEAELPSGGALEIFGGKASVPIAVIARWTGKVLPFHARVNELIGLEVV